MGYQKQPDFGTPASRSDVPVTLTIDGREVTIFNRVPIQKGEPS